MNVVIIGPALNGNKGAAAMIESSVALLEEKYHNSDLKISLLSYYYKLDLNNNYLGKRIRILNSTPLYLALVIFPLAIIARLRIFRGLVSRFNKEVHAILEADLILDQGGITFSDGREKYLIFNVATLLPMIILDKKIVKCAQALGPFKNKLNRFLAGIFLPKCHAIIARGTRTLGFLEELKLSNVVLGTDLAFSLKDEVRSDILSNYVELFNTLRGERLFYCPSVVVGLSLIHI